MNQDQIMIWHDACNPIANIISPSNNAPMKQLLILFTSLAFVLPAHSQGPESFTDKKNEINIGFFNAFELNNFSDLGIGYKRMSKTGAWRFGTGLSFSASDSDNDNGGIQTSDYFLVAPRIGYEWHQNFNRLQLQYGTDLATHFYRSSLEDTNEAIDYYRFEQKTVNKYSIRPFLGLKVFITKSISLSTETYLDIGFSTLTFESNNNTPTNTIRKEKTTSVMLGPLGVFSINFHF